MVIWWGEVVRIAKALFSDQAIAQWPLIAAASEAPRRQVSIRRFVAGNLAVLDLVADFMHKLRLGIMSFADR